MRVGKGKRGRCPPVLASRVHVRRCASEGKLPGAVRGSGRGGSVVRALVLSPHTRRLSTPPDDEMVKFARAEREIGVVRVAWCASGAWRSLSASLDATREQVMLIGSAKLTRFGRRTTRAACQSFASRDTQRDDHAPLAHQATRATPNFLLRAHARTPPSHPDRRSPVPTAEPAGG